MPTARENWVQPRVNLPTTRDSAGMGQVPPEIRARAFFSARVAEAHILDRFRAIEDDFLSGKIGRDEARNLMMDYAIKSGKDDGTRGIKNLASTARLNLIIDQNALMAKAVGDYERMYSPAGMEAFPYVIFHASVGSKKPRPEHQQWDGMIFDKTDPWLKSHWPPLDFGCHCELENCSRKKAGKYPDKVQQVSPPSAATPPAGGFTFDPSNGFEQPADLGNLQPVSRKNILKQAEEAVKSGGMGKCGMIVAPPATGNAPAPLPNLPQVKKGFDAMKDAARQELTDVGLDPDHLPDYDAVNKAFQQAEKQGKNIPVAVSEQFPKEPIEVTTINSRVADAADIPSCPVALEVGNSRQGIAHLWRDHKDLFADPDKAIRLLEETLGDPNCRVVVGLEPITVKQLQHGKLQKVQDCLKRIIVHSPAKKAYCVMNYDGNTLKLVSWHNAVDEYGSEKWALK